MLSRNFRLQKVGDMAWLQNNYDFSKVAFSIDELVVLDVSRNQRDIDQFSTQLQTLSRGCFVPISAGGASAPSRTPSCSCVPVPTRLWSTPPL